MHMRIAAFVLVVCLAVTVPTHGESIIEDDFESYAVDSFPFAKGWRGNSAKDCTVKVVAEGAGNQCVRFFQNTETMVCSMGISSARHITRGEWRFRAKWANTEGSWLLYLQGDKNVAWLTAARGAIAWVKSSGGVTIGRYEPGRWYAFRVVFDCAQGKADLHIDDRLAGQGLPFYQDARYACAMKFRPDNGVTNAMMFLDDVDLFESGGSSAGESVPLTQIRPASAAPGHTPAAFLQHAKEKGVSGDNWQRVGYAVNPEWRAFHSALSPATEKVGETVYRIRLDDELAYESPAMSSGDAAVEVEVPLVGRSRMTLEAAGTRRNAFEWRNAEFVRSAQEPHETILETFHVAQEKWALYRVYSFGVPQFTVAFGGPETTATLRFHLANKHTHEKLMVEQPIALEKLDDDTSVARGTFDFSAVPYGAYKVKVELVDASGKVVLTEEDWLAHAAWWSPQEFARMRDECARTGEEPILGVKEGVNYYFESPVDLSYRWGAPWAHVHTCWERAQPTRDTWALSHQDEYMRRFREMKRRTCFCLANFCPLWVLTPPEERDGIDPGRSAQGWFHQPIHDMDDWRNLVRNIVLRYRGAVSAWEVWNELDSKPGVADSANNADVEYVREAYLICKQFDPKTPVIMGAHASNGLNYIDSLLSRGAAPYVDGIAIHPYRGPNPEVPTTDGYWRNASGTCDWLTMLDETRQLPTFHGRDGLPVYITEMNWYPTIQHCTEEEQVTSVVRSHIMTLMRPWVKFYSLEAVGNTTLPGPNLSSVAYPFMTRMLTGAKFLERVEADDPHVWCVTFERRDKKLVTLWSVLGESAVRVKGFSGVEGAFDMFGNPADLGLAQDGADVTLTGRPIYIIADRQSEVALAQLIKIAVPALLYRGNTYRITVSSKIAQVTGLSMTCEDWPVSQEGEVFSLAVPRDSAIGKHRLRVTFSTPSGGSLAQTEDIRVGLSQADLARRHHVVFADDFSAYEIDSFPGSVRWKGPGPTGGQVDARVVPHPLDKGKKALRLLQKSVDLAAAIEVAGLPEAKVVAVQFDLFAPQWARPGKLVFRGADGNAEFTINAKGELTVPGSPALELAAGELNHLVVLINTVNGEFTFLHRKRSATCVLDATSGSVEAISWQLAESYDHPAEWILCDVDVREVTVSKIDGHAVTPWLVAGPFPAPSAPTADGAIHHPAFTDADLLADCGGEEAIRPFSGFTVRTSSDESVSWNEYSPPPEEPDHVNFFKVSSLGLAPQQSNIVTYCAAYVQSEREARARLLLGSDDGHKVWLNGGLAGHVEAYRGAGRWSERYDVILRKGINRILVKVDQGDGSYELYFGLETGATEQRSGDD